MKIIIHRVNKIADLKNLPPEYGVEIDVRFDNRNGKLYLNHEPGEGEDLEAYLKFASGRFVIFNIKEAGIEQTCINLANKYNIAEFFLLDVEFPYLYKTSRQGYKKIAVRYSEAEPIELALAQKSFVNWVWIDVNTKLPLNPTIINKLQGFQTCLVSPECWGRPEDILKYRQQMNELNFTPTAVMCDLEFAEKWK